MRGIAPCQRHGRLEMQAQCRVAKSRESSIRGGARVVGQTSAHCERRFSDAQSANCSVGIGKLADAAGDAITQIRDQALD